jgi:hypothetical protein
MSSKKIVRTGKTIAKRNASNMLQTSISLLGLALLLAGMGGTDRALVLFLDRPALMLMQPPRSVEAKTNRMNILSIIPLLIWQIPFLLG